MEKDILKKFIDKGLSQREIARELKKSQTTVKYWLHKFGLKTKNTEISCGYLKCLNCDISWLKKEKRAKKYCSTKCQHEYARKEYIRSWQNGEVDGNKGIDQISNHVRNYLFEKYENKCCKCGWNEINEHTGYIPLTVNHIDGNYSNSIEENLELICPNCHSLTPSYGGRNKGNGRPYRQLWRYRNNN